jgi:hypothetical protein
MNNDKILERELSPEMEKKFYDEYTVKMIRNGRWTTLVAALFTFLPALYLWLILGFRPTWGQIGTGWSIILSAYLIIYFVEPLGFYPVMGLSGIYIGYLAGNIPAVRLPAMLASQTAVKAEAGTKKGEIAGTIGIGTSVFISLIFVTAAALAGAQILAILPQFVISAFSFTLPSILGAVIAQYFVKNPSFVVLIMVVCIGVQMAPLPNVYKFPLGILLSFILGFLQYQKILKPKRLAASGK